MDECPICIEPLSGTFTTMGCCKKTLHVDCYIKCMKQKPACPMCRAGHDVIQDIEQATVTITPHTSQAQRIIKCIVFAVISGIGLFIILPKNVGL